MQKQGVIKSLKINTYLTDKSAGIIGNTTYKLCTLPTAYHPKTTLTANFVVGRQASGTNSTPLMAQLVIDTAGGVLMVPFQNITINAINIAVSFI